MDFKFKKTVHLGSPICYYCSIEEYAHRINYPLEFLQKLCYKSAAMEFSRTKKKKKNGVIEVFLYFIRPTYCFTLLQSIRNFQICRLSVLPSTSNVFCALCSTLTIGCLSENSLISLRQDLEFKFCYGTILIGNEQQFLSLNE